MNIEEAKRVSKEKIEQLAAELERGQSDTLKAYLSAMAKFPRYSINNTLLILAQCPQAKQVCGLTTWNRLGRCIRKGERGIAILAPIIRKQKWADAVDCDEDETVVGFRGAHVFDVGQTEGGTPLPEPACVNGDPGIYFDRLTQAIADRGIQLTYSRVIGAAHGVSTRKRIVLHSNLGPAERFATAAHELGHILLEHHKPDDPGASATLRETEAEAVAYVVCQAIGLETGTASSDYVQVWGGDAKTLAASLERIQRTASEIIAAIGPDV